MSQTYQTIGIVLKQKPFNENDLLVTILSPEIGLISAVAPGARKYKSRLRGRIQSFVINQFLIVQGKNLDRVIQAETKESYPKLSQNLGKLTASQYLGEIALNLAPKNQPQPELYTILNEHLNRIEKIPSQENLVPYLTQAVFHLLTVTGIAPEVNYCIETHTPLIPQFELQQWQVGFSFGSGGLIKLSPAYHLKHHKINTKVNALELFLLQSLAQKTLNLSHNNSIPQESKDKINCAWINIERSLSNYIEFYLGHSLKSTKMISFALNQNN